jgi:3-methyladenine DNA glycosylase AlkD
MTYDELVEELRGKSELKFADFQRRLIPTKQTILGVRTPEMRAIAKVWKGSEEALLAFPDEFYEVTFIKLCAVSALGYEDFCRHVERCVGLIDNWATCDSFKAGCVKAHKEDFLPILDKLFARGGEFYERYVLVTLLGYYVEEKYLPTIKSYLAKTNCEKYNAHMAAAWLTAEVLAKYYEAGVDILKSGILPDQTRNKAIQKARESYRITTRQKELLLALKKQTEK